MDIFQDSVLRPLDSLASLDSQALADFLAQAARQARQVRRVRREMKEQAAIAVIQANLERQVIQDSLVILPPAALAVSLVIQDSLAIQVQAEHQALAAILGHQATREQAASLAILVSLVRTEHQDIQALAAILVRLAIAGSLAIQQNQEQADLVDIQDHQERPALADTLAHRALVLILVHLALAGIQDKAVSLAIQVLLALAEPADGLELQVSRQIHSAVLNTSSWILAEPLMILMPAKLLRCRSWNLHQIPMSAQDGRYSLQTIRLPEPT